MVLKDSPCKNQCFYDSRIDLCTSCGRTLYEISKWVKFSPQDKETINKNAKKRLKQFNDA